jgi:hypothetical protein
MQCQAFIAESLNHCRYPNWRVLELAASQIKGFTVSCKTNRRSFLNLRKPSPKETSGGADGARTRDLQRDRLAF